MKIVALDLGDVWTGSAISDELGITARPYETVKTTELIPFLDNLIKTESISTIVVGHPKTMGGRESEQTKKVVAKKEELQITFPDTTWVLWDERLSSKRAEASLGKRYRDQKSKFESHSIAAAFILQTYLDFAALNR